MEEMGEYLVEQYDDILRIISRKVPEGDVADVAQEVCFQFLKTSGLYQGKCTLRTWLFRIVKNAISSYYRKKNRKVEGGLAVRDEKDIPQGVMPPIIYLHPDDVLWFIPRVYREVLILSFWEGMSQVAIARMLRLHPEAIRSRYRRGLAFCRKNMGLVMENISVERDIDIEWIGADIRQGGRYEKMQDS